MMQDYIRHMCAGDIIIVLCSIRWYIIALFLNYGIIKPYGLQAPLHMVLPYLLIFLSCHDIAHTFPYNYIKCQILSQYDYPNFILECWKAIILHEFVDFDKILASHYFIESTYIQIKILVDRVKIHTKGVKVNYSVSNHGKWSTA